MNENEMNELKAQAIATHTHKDGSVTYICSKPYAIIDDEVVWTMSIVNKAIEEYWELAKYFVGEPYNIDVHKFQGYVADKLEQVFGSSVWEEMGEDEVEHIFDYVENRYKFKLDMWIEMTD